MENKVKGYRCSLGLTQKKMADILGMSTNSYASKENGKSDFKVKEINKFINFMKNNIIVDKEIFTVKVQKLQFRRLKHGRTATDTK